MAVIMLLEDDHALSKGIQTALKKDFHTVMPAYSFFEGVQAYMCQTVDLFLLDINLPDGDGMEFCKKIRKETTVPIIFLTAKDTEEEMLEGFHAGCDDYIAKPFSVEVLRRKVQVLLSRSVPITKADGHLLHFKDLTINTDRMQVSKGDVLCKLTATEYKLLEYMARNKGKVLTRNMLLEQIWDIDGNFIDENTLSVHVRRLRQKLESDPKNPKYIITVFGIGYTLGE